MINPRLSSSVRSVSTLSVCTWRGPTESRKETVRNEHQNNRRRQRPENQELADPESALKTSNMNHTSRKISYPQDHLDHPSNPPAYSRPNTVNHSRPFSSPPDACLMQRSLSERSFGHAPNVILTTAPYTHEKMKSLLLPIARRVPDPTGRKRTSSHATPLKQKKN